MHNFVWRLWGFFLTYDLAKFVQEIQILLPFQQKAYLTFYKNGIINGVVTHFYDNRKLKYKSLFKNGIEDGAFKQYYENGVLEIETFYKNGKLEGLRRDYYKSGKLEVEGLQKNGKP